MGDSDSSDQQHEVPQSSAKAAYITTLSSNDEALGESRADLVEDGRSKDGKQLWVAAVASFPTQSGN